jgi:hypothetical protein
MSPAAMQLRDCFRLLWSQHVYWTRMAIMGIVYDLPDTAQTTNRLLRNAPDFGKLFCRFYGEKIGREFCRLLKEHLVIAGELVKAAKAGNSKAATCLEKKWYKNADEIVCFLTHINSCWSEECARAMWYKHLALTKEEAIDLLTQNYSGSIKTFNKIEKEAMMMADDFAKSFIGQFNV